MKLAVLCLVLLSCFAQSAALSALPEPPQPAAAAPRIAAPKDVPFPGLIELRVDATDLDHAVLSIHETVPVAGLERITLLYPQWVVGNHGPSGHIDKLAGLLIHAAGRRLDWVRDPVNMYAFHVELPGHVDTLDVDFQYLSPPSAGDGRVIMSGEMIDLEWHTVVLYPAGYFARQIRIEPSLQLPSGFTAATALTPAGTQAGLLQYETTTLETLVDSPVVAGLYVKRIDLDPGAATRVTLNIIADAPRQLDASSAQIQAHRALVQQAYRVFGPGHYDHYDFLLYLSDRVGSIGFEHQTSSEVGIQARYFTDWDQTSAGRDVLPHEYVHSWNGKFRRPAGLWIPAYYEPMRDDLLWIYEGQTEYWGFVLAARSGILTSRQALEAIASIAATFEQRPGRLWRPLQDTTNDPIFRERKPQSWLSWQREEDYYREGLLIWLDVDTLIRERSGGKRSLDDFALAFYGIDRGSMITHTYTLDEVIRVLNSVQPYDWRTFFEQRLRGNGPHAPLDGLARGGYALTYDAHESDYAASLANEKGIIDLTFSGGFTLDNGASFTDILWESAAFKAGLQKGMQLVAVDGESYTPRILKEALERSKTSAGPIELLVKSQNRYRTVHLDYHDGLRYPHLQRIGTGPARLDEVLSSRP